MVLWLFLFFFFFFFPPLKDQEDFGSKRVVSNTRQPVSSPWFLIWYNKSLGYFTVLNRCRAAFMH